MSFNRNPAPHVVAHGKGAAIIRLFACRDLIGHVASSIDQFGIDDPCPVDQIHEPIISGDAIVCWRCSKVWLP